MYIPKHTHTHKYIYIRMYRTHPQFKAQTPRVDMHIYTVRTYRTKKPVVSDITAACVYAHCAMPCASYLVTIHKVHFCTCYSATQSHKSEAGNRSQGLLLQLKSSAQTYKHTHTNTHTCHSDYTLRRKKKQKEGNRAHSTV